MAVPIKKKLLQMEAGMKTSLTLCKEFLCLLVLKQQKKLIGQRYSIQIFGALEKRNWMPSPKGN